mgnify:CR=1 FL=1|jgi:uncharacterized SAM-binding protein YcdF (DUF218 family)
MFFKKKRYLFPIEKPPSKLDYRKIIIALISFYIIAIIFMFYIIKSSDEISQKTTDYFFNRSPDLIVVPTGDKGRISLAIDMAQQHNLSNIFITGVYKKNSLENIIPKDLPEDININFFEIDYVASNTVENAILTLRYIRHHQEIKRVLVISSDYHIPRIKMIFDQLTLPSDEFKIFYQGKPSNYKSLRSLKKLHFEMIKYIRNFVMLTMWTPEIEEV